MTGPGDSNFGVILKNLEKLSRPAEERPGAPEPTPSGGEPKQFVVEKILITDVTAKVRYEAAGATVADTAVRIDRIEIDDLDSEGLTVSELTSLIVRTILSSTLENGAGVLPEDVRGELGERLEDARERGKQELLDAAKGLFEK